MPGRSKVRRASGKKEMIMKKKIEEKDNKTEMDFFDWWDSFESRVVPAQKMPEAMDERARKISSRA
jgi:hypothetical protein